MFLYARHKISFMDGILPQQKNSIVLHIDSLNERISGRFAVLDFRNLQSMWAALALTATSKPEESQAFVPI